MTSLRAQLLGQVALGSLASAMVHDAPLAVTRGQAAPYFEIPRPVSSRRPPEREERIFDWSKVEATLDIASGPDRTVFMITDDDGKVIERLTDAEIQDVIKLGLIAPDQSIDLPALRTALGEIRRTATEGRVAT